MAKINSVKLFELLQDKSLHSFKASQVPELVNEINKVSGNYNSWLKNLYVEQCVKRLLWDGILKQYGTFGTESGQTREYIKYDGDGTKKYYNFNQKFSKGKLLSIDFGISNIDRELSLTHTGIVVADYTGMVVVVPITSQSSLEYNNLATDIQTDVLSILKKDYPQIENDSYVLMHQMRVISKNRITKKGIIGSIANTPILREIEMKIIRMCAFDYYDEQELKIKTLEDRIQELENINKQLQLTIDKK